MTPLLINHPRRVRVLKELTMQELTNRISPYVSNVKAIMGTVITGAFWEMTNAFYAVRNSSQYRQDTKRAFNRAMAGYFDFEHRLAHPYRGVQYFSVEHIPAESRKRFNDDFTDEQFFEFWQGMSSLAYEKAQPHINALRHKFERSIQRNLPAYHDYKVSASALTAAAIIQLAIYIYDRTINVAADDARVDVKYMDAAFGVFNLVEVGKLWQKATTTLRGGNDPLTKEENHDIELSIHSIIDLWAKDDNLVYDCYQRTVEDFGEIFRTRGEQKKLLKEIIGYKS